MGDLNIIARGRTVFVKLKENRGYSVIQTRREPIAEPGSTPIDWDRIRGELPIGSRIRQSFPLTVGRLRASGGLRAGPGGRPETSLDLYLRVRLAEGADAKNSAAKLERLPEVAWTEVGPEWTGDERVRGKPGCDKSGSVPKYVGPEGINAGPVWEHHRGAGVTLCVLERSYYADHLLLQKPAGSIGTLSALYQLPADDQLKPHGTHTLGVLCPDDPQVLRGICPDAHVVVVPTFTGPWDEYANGTDCSDIECALDYVGGKLHESVPLVPHGSVVLIEASNEASGISELPVDRMAGVRRFLRSLASQFGITAVIPVGNGDQSLSNIMVTALEGEGASVAIWAGDGFQEPNDSMAVLVGAGRPGDYKTRWRDDGVGSNYGERVDCQAWGDSVCTCGEPPMGLFTYNGTSAAAAIIAGVVTCLQGAMIKAGKAFLSPETIRKLLREGAKKDPNLEIGPLPDLKELIDKVVQDQGVQ